MIILITFSLKNIVKENIRQIT